MSLPIIIALVAFVFVFISLGLKIVPETEAWVITRLGSYNKTLRTGVNIIFPFVDKIHSKVQINDQVMQDINLDVVSKDNVVYGVQLLVIYKIENPEAAVFRVNSIRDLVIGLVQSLVRSELGKADLDQVQSDRGSLNIALFETLEEAGKTYGIKISRAEIIDVQLNAQTQASMSEVLIADRLRRAEILRAEGARRATELAADAKFYEAEREAEGIRVLAQANADSNKILAESLNTPNADKALIFQTTKIQVDAIEKLAGSSNAKLIMLPGGSNTNAFAEAAGILTMEKKD